MYCRIGSKNSTEALIEAGYDDFDCFDFKYTPVEEILKQLVQEVKLKRPHAQKLLAKLRERTAVVDTEDQIHLNVLLLFS